MPYSGIRNSGSARQPGLPHDRLPKPIHVVLTRLLGYSARWRRATLARLSSDGVNSYNCIRGEFQLQLAAVFDNVPFTVPSEGLGVITSELGCVFV